MTATAEKLGAAFICPRCATATTHPLEVRDRWCGRCGVVTGPPGEAPAPRPVTPWQAIRDNQDACLIAIERGKPLPTGALLALPPWRAVLMASVARRAGVGLADGTLEQLKKEAWRAGGDGRLGSWWEGNHNDHRSTESVQPGH